MYSSHDVCIVGRGSVFSGTWSAEEFLDSLYEGKSSITDLRNADRSSFPWDVSLVYNSDKKAEDQSYTPYGAYIDRAKLEEVVKKNGGDWLNTTTLEAVGLEALRQAIDPVKSLPELKKAEIILGLSTIDTEATFTISDELLSLIYPEIDKEGFPREEAKHLREVYQESFNKWRFRKPTMSYVVATQLANTMKRAFGLEGPACQIDAACASSLAAYHIAIKKLRQGETDMVITGGADVSVSPGCLVFFSRLGAMSTEINAPFDESAGGLTQGEGAAVFVLMRLQDAINKGLKIYGVLKACEGSSDGKSSAIVEPTVEGQLLAYQRTYADAGVTDVDYIEAHGTGTQVGDRTEIESLSQQFPTKKIPIGSVKANIGHTIAAAGAAGLLKNLGVIERKMVPPSPHFKRFPAEFETQLFVSQKPLEITSQSGPLTLGQSAFGFGGSNFHLVVQEYRPDLPVIPREPKELSRVVICGQRSFTLEQLSEFSKSSQYRLPPNIVPRIERVQLLALQAVEQTFRELGILPQLLDRARVSVISSTMVPLESYWTAGRRVISSALRRFAQRELKDPLALKKIEEIFARIEAGSMRVNEDTLVGFLNNVIAGRVCNAFDFKGVSFNLDADLAGKVASLRAAQTLLAENHGMIILLSSDEKIRNEEQKIERTRLECTILASPTYALEHDLPISEILESVRYTETIQ